MPVSQTRPGPAVPAEAEAPLSAETAAAATVRGLAELRVGRRAEALACFERAMVLVLGHRAARLSAATALLDLSRLDESEAGYHAAL